MAVACHLTSHALHMPATPCPLPAYPAFPRIRFVEQLDRMPRLDVHAFAAQAGADLHEAAGIAGGDGGGGGVADEGELGLEHGVRHVRLDEVVDAGAAAALIA